MATAKYKKGKDGFYATKVWDGTYNTDGTKHRVNLRTDKSSRALENMVNEYKQKVNDRKIVKKSDEMFITYARTWLNVYKNNREANTKAMYDNIIEKHLIALDGVRLQDISRIHLQIVLNNASGKNRTQEQIMLTFKQILKSAVADKIYSKNAFSDIFDNVESIRYTSPERRALTEYERRAVFLADYKYTQDKIYTYIIYGCGLRREEATALTIFDFNFKSNTLTVNKAFEYTQNSPTEKEPKTKNGYRTIPIPTKILTDVKEYVQNKKHSGCTYLFTTRCGSPITKSSYDKMWHRIVEAIQDASDHDIVGLTGHLFRHNYCTTLCYQIPKISIKHIAKLFGDTEAVVLRIYNHIMMEKEDAVTAVNDAMNF